MLGDAANSYNPIIQAMIATANLKQKSQQQEQEKEKNKAEQAAQKEHLKQAQQILENVHEHNLAQEDVARMQAEADHLRAKSATFLALQQARQQGSLDPVKAFEMIQPHLTQALRANPALGKFKEQLGGKDLPAAEVNPEMPGLGGGQPQTQGPTNTVATPTVPQMTPDEMFGNPETQIDLQARGRGKIAGAEAAARLPSEKELAQFQFGFSKQLQDAAHESAMKIAELGKATQYDIAKLSKETQLAIANMTNRTHLQIAGMGGDEQSQQVMKSLMLGMATGEIKPSGTNPLERIAYSNLEAQGFRPVDAKEVQALKDSQQLLPLFDKLETFAKSLPKSRAQGAVQGALLGAQKAIGYTSKQQNDLNIINSQAMNVGKAVEGIGGRPLATQMKLDLDALASGSISQEDAISRINNLRDLYVNKQDKGIFSGMIPAQEELIRSKFGVQRIAGKSPQSQPEWLKMAPKTNKKGHKLDDAESVKAGHPVYGEQ